jgi:hypothetical protein
MADEPHSQEAMTTAKTEPDSLEPCPLGCAGGELHPHVCEWERPDAWQVYCQRCLVSTRVHDSKENAVADWNRSAARLESLRGAEPKGGERGAIEQLERIAKAFGYTSVWADPKDRGRWFCERPTTLEGYIQATSIDDLVAGRVPSWTQDEREAVFVASEEFASAVGSRRAQAYAATLRSMLSRQPKAET